MNTITLFLVSFAAGLLGLYIIYWTAVRPALLRRFQAKIYNLRREVEDKIIAKEQGWGEESALELLKELRFAGYAHHFSLLAIMISLWRNQPNKAQIQKEKQLFYSAPLWIRESSLRLRSLVLGMMTINSPVWFPAIMAFSVFLLCSDKAKNYMDKFQEAATYYSTVRSRSFST